MVLDIAKELEKTLHLHSTELPYVQIDKGMEFRLLHARPQENYYVTQIRAQPGVEGGLHKHPFERGAGGFTLRGAWGHDHQYLYRPGTYIFETPGVIHQFLNGPEETEILFFGDLHADFVDPETLGIKSVVTADKIIKRYIEQCEEQGITPHYLK
ncbi:cupin domain-containing protein [Sphingobium subterraneum]|uniref:Quercetin dioxygenase-like cupin family protein n=1 Tax=Sphingobium subterraneum TaxID=627688 RepID=A0A841IXI6_9SPHN|nr:cupin domain-containing protein [Sphingobium subterraneum]MBB6123373.1 quercetin dioxygenase-like cupin family protein [Sphingobium subterraneum]